MHVRIVPGRSDNIRSTAEAVEKKCREAIAVLP